MVDKATDKELGGRIQSEIRRTGASIEAVAEACGISVQGVYKWFKTGQIARNHLPVLKQKFGIDINALLAQHVQASEPPNAYEVLMPPSELIKVDFISGARLSAGGGEILWDYEVIQDSHGFRLDWMQKKGLRADRCRVWTVDGYSMEPKYSHGDWVLINSAQRDPVHGKVFALIGDEGLRLKQLLRTAAGWTMHSFNEDKTRYPDEPIIDDNYAIIGRVRGRGGDED